MGEGLALLGGPRARNKPFDTLPKIGPEEKKAVMEALAGGMLSGFIAQPGDSFLGGSEVKELEEEFCRYFKVKFAVAMNSATSCLHAAVSAAGIGPGDEVIVTPYTMSASATCILMQNGIPVFADIDEDTFCIDPKDIRRKITKNTKAIVVVHLFGQSADMDEIMAIAKEHDLFVIEDAAQAPGAVYKGRLAGTIGDIGIFSFNQHKLITTGEGGIAVCNNPDLALHMQLLRNHGEVVVGKMEVKDAPPIVGYNYRMNEIEAAIGIHQFKRLDSMIRHTERLGSYLSDKLSGLEGIEVPRVSEGNNHIYLVYAIKFKAEIMGISRELFMEALKAEGVPGGGGYVRPIYEEPIYQGQKGYGQQGCPFKCPLYGKEIRYQKGDCPVVERMHYKELILLPVCRPAQTFNDMDDVVGAFKKVLGSIDELKAYQEEKRVHR